MTEELSENTEIENAIDESQISDDEFPELEEQDSDQPQLEMDDSPELDIEEQQEEPAPSEVEGSDESRATRN